MKEIGLYVIITEPVKSYEDIAKICVDKNIRALQLREKNLDDRTVLSIAEKILKITKGTSTNFIINDRIDLVLASDADGVHLGQNDLPYKYARRLLPDKIIGLSTHSIEQAEEAIKSQPDYIGFGPVYKTPTKKIPDPVVGTDLLSKVIDFSNIPVVAIGGIDESNIKNVIKVGAKSLSLVRYLMNYKDLEKRITFIQKILKERK